MKARADGGMRAYVTGGARPPVTTRARQRHACALRPHATSRWRARWLAAHERREGLAQHAPHVGGDLGGRAQVDGGRRLRCSAGATAPTGGNAQGSGGAMVPVVLTGTRDCEHRSRARTPRRSRYPEVAPDVSIPRQARTATPLQTLLASTTEATKQHCSVSLKNPALTLSVNTWPPLAGCLPTGRLEDGRLPTPPPSKTAKLLSDRLGDGHCYSPASCDARAVMRLTAPFSTRNALTARTKQYGLTSRSSGPKTQLSEACLYRPRWTARLWLATCTT